jgi:hypothetical protein
MGRVKKYSKQHTNKHRKLAGANKRASSNNTAADSEMVDQKSLPIAKRKQIFKKKERRDVKLKIKELRLQSLKLKKKNLGQKAEKKEIAH